jgi:hypothetical protein
MDLLQKRATVLLGQRSHRTATPGPVWLPAVVRALNIEGGRIPVGSLSRSAPCCKKER